MLKKIEEISKKINANPESITLDTIQAIRDIENKAAQESGAAEKKYFSDAGQRKALIEEKCKAAGAEVEKQNEIIAKLTKEMVNTTISGSDAEVEEIEDRLNEATLKRDRAKKTLERLTGAHEGGDADLYNEAIEANKRYLEVVKASRATLIDFSHLARELVERYTKIERDSSGAAESFRRRGPNDEKLNKHFHADEYAAGMKAWEEDQAAEKAAEKQRMNTFGPTSPTSVMIP